MYTTLNKTNGRSVCISAIAIIAATRSIIAATRSLFPTMLNVSRNRREKTLDFRSLLLKLRKFIPPCEIVLFSPSYQLRQRNSLVLATSSFYEQLHIPFFASTECDDSLNSNVNADEIEGEIDLESAFTALEILEEYKRLIHLPKLSKEDAQRMGMILELATYDRTLAQWLEKSDCEICDELNDDEENMK